MLECNISYSSMFDEIDNDFSFRDQSGYNDEPKDWVNLPEPAAIPNKIESRWIECRRKLMNDSIDTNEVKDVQKLNHKIAKESSSVFVKSKHSRLGKAFKWFFSTLLWKWLFKRKSLMNEKVFNNVKVRK